MQSEYNKNTEKYLYYCNNHFCNLYNIEFTEGDLQDIWDSKAIKVIIKHSKNEMKKLRIAAMNILRSDRQLIVVTEHLSKIKKYKFKGRCPICKQEMKKGKGIDGDTYYCVNKECALYKTIEICETDITSKEKLLACIYNASYWHYWLFSKYWKEIKNNYNKDLNTFSRLFEKMDRFNSEDSLERLNKIKI